ncbi:MAG: DUF2807 domain-containing protein [Odoribacter sp.]|nr:DUF2807 domain-containing protein [Odoribacter sp.]
MYLQQLSKSLKPKQPAEETSFIMANHQQPILTLHQGETSIVNKSGNINSGTMKTNKLFALILLGIALFQVNSVQAVKSGDGRQTRQVTGFHGVSVSSGIDLYLTQKNVEEVFVEADSDDLDKIITRVESGILKIYVKEKSWFSMNWNNQSRKVYVSFISLDKLEASAGSDVYSQGVLSLNELDMDASSGSDIKLELEANELSVESSSGSDINVKGKVNVLQASASSGSDINASELHAKKCIASVSSGSDIRVNVSEELDANASSGGDITYSGNPKTKDINKSSGGDVHGK